MKIFSVFINAILVNLLVVIGANADVPAAHKAEVSHLLDFIKNSGCIIIRNGREHRAEDGMEHINKKYDYFRDDIHDTEDFIEYSATKSTMSGDYYMVICPGETAIRTQDWLLDELMRYRAAKK